LPHVPQLLTSPNVPLEQAHVPLTQVVPALHTVPHVPQLLLSLVRSTHAPSCWQKTCPGTEQVQLPPSQNSASGQTTPHAPQLLGSRIRSMHPPAHRDSPVGQVQLPLTQVFPAPHTVPHAPQLFESVARLTHFPLQRLSPVEQQRPNSAAPCLTVGLTQFREQQDIEVWHCWPSGLHMPACAAETPTARVVATTTIMERRSMFGTRDMLIHLLR
jgi:hypothetical protein